MRHALLCILLSGLAAPGPAHSRTSTTAERKACEAKVLRELESIDARLRAGYSAEEGEKLTARRRKLEKARAECRYTK